MHEEYFGAKGAMRPTAEELESFCVGWHPKYRRMFRQLPLRCREMVFYKLTLDPPVKSNILSMDVSQMVSWLPTSDDGLSTCLTEHSTIFLTDGKDLNRILMGPEAFALQGGTKHHFASLEQTTPDLLADLAGNMFNGPVFMGIFVALLCAVPAVAS